MITPTTKLTNLNQHSTVWLFPSLGGWDPTSESWRLTVAGAVFRPSIVKLPKRLQVKILRKAMQVPLEAFDSPIFRERISPFLGAPHRGRRLALEIDGSLYQVPRKSRRNGHFAATLRLRDTSAHVPPQGTSLPVATWRNGGPQTTVGGRVHLLPPRGISVVSDIDDTIKESGVGCRRTLLTNTFLKEFSAVDGMADLYAHWSRQGAAFHYVSSSPWQLLDPLDQWRSSTGLPDGSVHLRLFKLGDHMMRHLLRMRRHGKARVISHLVRQFPQREFVLIGDSTEHDPEIYGALARRFPNRVTAVFIRQMPHNPLGPTRAATAFRDVRSHWSCFENPSELPRSIHAIASQLC